MTERRSAQLDGLSRERLAELLREAAGAHHEHEQELGHRDEDRPSWYAGYMLERLREG